MTSLNMADEISQNVVTVGVLKKDRKYQFKFWKRVGNSDDKKYAKIDIEAICKL